jgi:hypothetical protein
MPLTNGQWLQVRFNARHSRERSWYYEKHVLNLGIVSTYSPDLFISGAPTFVAPDLADLR